jgi:hypothetical protein
MATDGHVISPLFFPGGDIGCLAVHGTVNDVAMMGATPLYLSASFIIEEGFPLADLQRIVQSMGNAAREAGVPVVTGDTKVVEKGKGDGVFISTTGVGVLPPGMSISGRNAQWATWCCSRAPSATTAWPCCRSASLWPLKPPYKVRHRRAAHPGGRAAGRRAGRGVRTCCATPPAAAWPPR